MTDSFYATAANYAAVITTGTVNSISVVGSVICTWSIENRNDQMDMVKINSVAASAVNLEQGAFALVRGAAIAGTLSTTQMSVNLSETTNDHYNGRVITWTSGQLNGQSTSITDYDGSGKILTYVEITENPAAADTFVIS